MSKGTGVGDQGGDQGTQPTTRVYRPGSQPQPALPAAADLFREAKAAGYAAAIVLTSNESARVTAKRQHDIKAALRTLGFASKALESGYKFQDEMAAAKIEAIAKAVALLEREGDLLLQVLTAE